MIKRFIKVVNGVIVQVVCSRESIEGFIPVAPEVGYKLGDPYPEVQVEEDEV